MERRDLSLSKFHGMEVEILILMVYLGSGKGAVRSSSVKRIRKHCVLAPPDLSARSHRNASRKALEFLESGRVIKQ